MSGRTRSHSRLVGTGNSFEMNVPERHDHLNAQREQREPSG